MLATIVASPMVASADRVNLPVSVFERYNIVGVGDLREAAKRLDIAAGTISGTIEPNRLAVSKA